MPIHSLRLLPKINWAGGIAETWTPGEQAAGSRLRRFVRAGLVRDADDRDRPDLPGTSRLSPHSHWGEISPRQVWQAVHNAVIKSSKRSAGQNASAFLRELGSRWFWDTLVDADLANNTFNWQWVAGCGADAAPYFRVFNPVSQGHGSDPQGRYVLRFLPELKGRSPAVAHRPLPPEEPGLGFPDSSQTYPAPIVDHPSARQRFLDLARVYRV